MTTDDDYKIAEFNPLDDEQLNLSCNLMKIVWGESEFSQFYYNEWLYRKNPAGFALGFLAFSQTTLAAQYVTSASQLWCPPEKRVSKVLMSLNTATHPEHQKKGLFSKTAKMTYELAAKKGYFAVYGFPNNNSLPGFKKLGFYELDALDLYLSLPAGGLFSWTRQFYFGLLACIAKEKKIKDLEYVGLDSKLCFDKDAEESFKSEYYHVPRTKAWLNWRYANHPSRNYLLLGSISSGFVIRVVEISGFRVCLLVDILGNIDRELIKYLRNFLKEKKLGIVISVLSKNCLELHPLLKTLLWLKIPGILTPKKFHVIFKYLNGAVEPEALPKFYFTLGDIDIL